MKKTILISSIFLSLSSLADDSIKKLDTQVVTSDLRDNKLAVEANQSMSILDSETLEKAGTQHLQDVLGMIPNLNWSSATNRPRYFQIRGIGERSQYEGAPNPSVGFVVDDIDFSALGGVATLFDIEQIEVLRGPQSSRYGANGLAGLVYIKSKDPEFENSYKISGIIGNDGDLGFGLRATGGLSETAAYRIAVQRYNANGFRYNDYLNRDDSNKRDELTARGKLFWQVNDDLKFNFTFLKVDINNGFDTFNPENTFVTHSDFLGKDAQDSVGVALKTNWQGGNFEVLSISSYMNAKINYAFDGDWGNDEYWAEYAPYDFTSDSLRERTHLSQELRFVGNNTIFGVYVLNMQEDNNINEFYNGEVYKNLNSQFEATSVALFAQLDTELSDKNTLTSGLRIEQRYADYKDDNGIDVSPRDSMWGGQLSFNHAIAENLNSYVTLARGFKAGGFNLSLDVPDELRQYQPEYLWSLESGAKGFFMDYRLQWNISAFYSKRYDMQISTSRQSDPNDPLTFVFFTGNAATGSNYGIETDFNYLLSDNFDVYGSLGLLNAKFDDFVTSEGNFNGRTQAHAPRYNFSLGVQYHSIQGFFARLDATGKSSFYFSDSHEQQAKSYQLYNLRIGYEKDNWQLSLWGNNIFNKKYATRGFYFGLEPPNYNDKLYTQLGSPRHIGLSFDFEF